MILIFGSGNTCFDENACLGDAVGPTVVDAQNCVYEVPDGASLGTAGMNVRVIYEGYRAEVLDEDHDEGFFLPDPQGHPNRFQLADGLCHGDAQGHAPRVLSVAASRTCASKNVYQPLCAHDQNTVALRPARAALYLLVDRGATMASYLGPQQSGQAKLVQLLDVALADPVFAATVAGFRFLPSGTTLGDSCSAGGYATPLTVPGVPASKQLGAYAELGVLKNPLVALFDTTATLPPGAPLALDAALDPAGVFAAQFPTMIDGSSVSYEKRVVVVATNRSLTDPGIECGSGNAALAVKNAAATTETFVLSLEDPSEASPLARQAAADQFAQDAALPSDHMIHAEDPQTSDQNVLQGVGTIIADLASCAYEKPGNLSDPSKASMTLHVPPVPVPGGVPVSVPIPMDATCGLANNSADGWNVVGGVVRVCGGSCQTIRQAIQANGGVTVSRFGGGEDAMAGQVLVDMTIAP